MLKQQLFDEKLKLFFNLKEIRDSDPRQIGSKETGSLVENYFFEQNFFVSCFLHFSHGFLHWRSKLNGNFTLTGARRAIETFLMEIKKKEKKDDKKFVNNELL